MDAALNELPQPERRRSFTPRQRAEIVWSQGYKCAHCECSLITRPFQIDHIQRLDALGKHEPDNWQALCVPCHAIKSRVDNREAKKGRRIRGDNKPRAKKAIPSRGFNKTLRRRMDGTTEPK